MKILRHFLAAIVLLSSPAVVQASALSDLISNAGFEWMVAKWGDKDTKGQVVAFGFEWRLDKNAIAVTMKSPERTAEAYAALKPGTEKIVHGGVDNHGSVAKGEWTLHEGKPFLRAQYETQDGDEGRIGILIEKKSDTEILVQFMKLDEEGDPEGDPKMSIPLVKL